MGDGPGRAQVSFDESHVNIKLPNRCRRCHTYNEDPEAPSLRESFVILLNQMTRSPQGACFLFCISLPYFALTGISLLLLLIAGHFTFATSLFHCGLILTLLWLCLLKYFGNRYAKEYCSEQDLFALNNSGVIHSTRCVIEDVSHCSRVSGVFLVRQPKQSVLKFLKDLFLWCIYRLVMSNVWWTSAWTLA